MTNNQPPTGGGEGAAGNRGPRQGGVRCDAAGEGSLRRAVHIAAVGRRHVRAAHLLHVPAADGVVGAAGGERFSLFFFFSFFVVAVVVVEDGDSVHARLKQAVPARGPRQMEWSVGAAGGELFFFSLFCFFSVVVVC